MNVLTVDIGGTNVKLLMTGATERRKFSSGRQLTPDAMVAGVKRLTPDWKYDVISLGYPGQVKHGQMITEPANLAPGWVGYDFQVAFGCPVKIVNDAVLQALGCYRGGTLLFLGLGTGLGTALIVDGTVVPLELGGLSVGKRTYEDYLGRRGLERLGRKKWQQKVHRVTERFVSALFLDDVVIGGGNAKELTRLPKGCRLGNNAKAFVGGFRLWEHPAGEQASAK